MAVAEFPLPPFPYEKDFFGSPFPKGGKKRFADFRKEIEQGEIKWTNKKKKLKKYSEHLTKHLRLRQRIVFKVILVRLGAFMTETFERRRSNQNRTNGS